MELHFDGKKPIEEILKYDAPVALPPYNENSNLLIQGDNLPALKALLYDYNLAAKIDLIYIDPPFSTNNTFRAGSRRAQTISMNSKDKVAYTDTLTGDAFLEFIRERLVVAKELMSEKGSIYLHIDYKIGHYIKIIMDEIFGQHNFHNDITRIKCNPKNFDRKSFGNIKDLILFYTKSSKNIWNQCYTAYTQDDINRLFKKTKNGRAYATTPLHAPGETRNGATSKNFKGIPVPEGRHWRCPPSELEELDNQGRIEWSRNNVPRKIVYADEQPGKKAQDIWDFKDPQYPKYPTEKSLELLKRIVRASSNENSLVLDFFCGSGTTLAAAESLSRRWIGIDSSPAAIDICYKRLAEDRNICSPYRIEKIIIQNDGQTVPCSAE